MNRKALLFIILLVMISYNALSYAKSRTGFKDDDVMYFIMVDRFYDANKENNVPLYAYPVPEHYEKVTPLNAPVEYQENLKSRYWAKKVFSEDKSYPKKYWGGDLQGVYDKLDYLKELGVTILWISPVFDNVNGVHYKFGDAPYHGYWTKDWYRPEEHFINPPQKGENLDEILAGDKFMAKFFKKAHDLGLKVMLDFPLNHSSPISLDLPLDPKKDAEYFLEYGAVYRNGKLFVRPCTPTPELSCKDTWTNSDFFNIGFALQNMQDKNEVKMGMLNLCTDINQRSQITREYMYNAFKRWTKLGADGFRIDANKHIFDDYLFQYAADNIDRPKVEGDKYQFLSLEEQLKELNPEVLILGEDFGSGPEKQDSIDLLNQSDRFTFYDFSLAYAIRNYFTGNKGSVGHPSNIEKIINVSATHEKHGNKLANDFITFINLHDIPRMLSMKDATIPRYLAAIKFLFLSRGIPLLAYGDELALAVPHEEKYMSFGEIGNDPWNRIMMDWEREKNQRFKNVQDTVKKLTAFRKKNPELKSADTSFLKPSNYSTYKQLKKGFSYLAFERKAKDKRIYYFYSDSKQKLTFKVDLPDGIYIDAIQGKGFYTVKNGEIDLKELEPHQVVVIESK